MAYDDVFKKIGSFGRYQKFIYLLQTLPVVFTAIQTYLSVFILYVPDHRCANPDNNKTKLQRNAMNSSMLYSKCESYYNNLTMESIHQMFDPMTESYHPHKVFTNNLMETKYISIETSADGNSTMHWEECKRWNYDNKEFETTFVTESNLVCSKKLYRTHAILLYMFGFTVGSILIGIFSDRFGRKRALMVSIVLYIGSNVSLSFVQEFWVFSALRFVSGVSVGGLLSTCYVMDLELVGPGMRMLAGMIYMLFWGLGALLLTGMAYLIRDWRNLNLSLALPTILFLFYIICVPESTRWLVVKGKREQAENIFRLIARRNNRPFQKPILPDENEEAQTAVPRMPFIALCSYPRLLLNTVVVFFNWFVVALVFLGLSWNVNNLAGDVFLNFFLTSISEIVGFLLCIPLLDRVGRKPVYVVSLLTGGFALLLTMVPVLLGSPDIQWMMFLLSLVGKVGSSAAFATIFLYSAELFPTVFRNTGLGIANFCARTGGMVAPYIPDLSQEVGGDFGRVLPMCIFGILAILAGLLSILLPETNKRKLPENLEDAVNFIQAGGRNNPGVEMNVVPPSNGNIHQNEELNPLNGHVQQSEESVMLSG